MLLDVKAYTSWSTKCYRFMKLLKIIVFYIFFKNLVPIECILRSFITICFYLYVDNDMYLFGFVLV